MANKTYTAYYIPEKAEGEVDPSRGGLPSEKEAWEYVFSRMCGSCKKEHKIATLGEDSQEYKDFTSEYEFPPSNYPSCSCEWGVISDEEYKHYFTKGNNSPIE